MCQCPGYIEFWVFDSPNARIRNLILKWFISFPNELGKLNSIFWSSNIILTRLGYLISISIDRSLIIYCHVLPIIDFITNYVYVYMFAWVWFLNLCSFLDATNIFFSYNSGDVDMEIPYVGTETWIKSLNLTIDSGWQPWLVDGQVAGLVLFFLFDRVNFSLFLN